MQIVFHEKFLNSYTSDPAAEEGRLDYAVKLLKDRYPFSEPEPCNEDDILMVHTPDHLNDVRRDEAVFDMAKLAAGSTLKASFFAREGEMSFALCRPPGHHAGPSSSWGFCYFSNIAIAAKKFLEDFPEKKILVVDFDLHYGDGTAKALNNEPNAAFYAFKSRNSRESLKDAENFLANFKADMVAVSAGFDRHINDWGGIFTTENYRETGRMLKEFTLQNCPGKLFAALEGGYNKTSLGDSLTAFLEGLEDNT